MGAPQHAEVLQSQVMAVTALLSSKLRNRLPGREESRICRHHKADQQAAHGPAAAAGCCSQREGSLWVLALWTNVMHTMRTAPPACPVCRALAGALALL